MSKKEFKIIVIGDNNLEARIAKLYEDLSKAKDKLHVTVNPESKIYGAMAILHKCMSSASLAVADLSIAIQSASQDIKNCNKGFMILDSISESAPISRKAWKKLKKGMRKQSEIKLTQADIWSNKWDKKIKKKL